MEARTGKRDFKERYTSEIFKTPHSSEWHREVAETTTVLLVEVGSTMHGVSVKRDDDIDEMGICIPPPEVVLGVGTNDAPLFEQYEFRTKAVGERSGPGDVDRSIYSLRKYVRMAAQGSPTVQMPLFAPDDMIRHIEWPGVELRKHRDLFMSRQLGHRFLGYLNRQRQYLDGTLAERVHRPELVERYGYDTKYAYHALRLAIQGTELITHGVITLPMSDLNREYLLEVRNGRYPLDEVLIQLDNRTHRLAALTEVSTLPEYPDYDRINSWLNHVHRTWWDGGTLP